LSKHTPNRKSRFNDMCVEALQETIREVLGATVADAYIKYTHNSLGIPHEETSDRLEAILSSLESIFGAGGNVLGMRLIRKLYAKAGIAFAETPGLTLGDYLKSLRREFQEKPTD